jgi:2,4-dienoyl-CoA reductase-like NADH-dependent reductase (Old Yellow Enzyme family)
LFTPLNAGAFDLRHRIVVDRGRAEPGGDEISGQTVITAVDSCLWGGLVIYDPGTHIWSREEGTSDSATARSAAAWRSMIDQSKSIGQISLARLTVDFGPRDTGSKGVVSLEHRGTDEIISIYVRAARCAKSIGFDGIELDGAIGSITDQILLRSPNVRSDGYGKLVDERINVVVELVDALTNVFGRDRVGVRLSPFARDDQHVEGRDVLGEALRALAEQEISYVHLLDTASLDLPGASARVGTSSAKALRNAYPGILIGSARGCLSYAIELVESRWADAVCFPDIAVDASLIRHLRSLWPATGIT